MTVQIKWQYNGCCNSYIHHVARSVFCTTVETGWIFIWKNDCRGITLPYITHPVNWQRLEWRSVAWIRCFSHMDKLQRTWSRTTDINGTSHLFLAPRPKLCSGTKTLHVSQSACSNDFLPHSVFYIFHPCCPALKWHWLHTGNLSKLGQCTDTCCCHSLSNSNI